MKFPYKPRQIRLAFLVCVLLCNVLVFGQVAPKIALPPANPKLAIHDLANVVDPKNEQEIDRILKNFRGLTGASIIVVTIDNLQGRSIEEYAEALYGKGGWGIGDKSGGNKDKGALLLVAPNERKSRLEVGYGLEGDLPDGLAGEQLRRMRPYFQQGQYGQGLNVGVRTLVDTLAEKWNVNVEGIDKQYAYHPQPQQAEPLPKGAIICFVIAVLLFFLLMFFASRRGGRGGPGSRYRNNSAWQAAPFIFNSGGGDYGSGSWGSNSGGGSWGGGSSDSGSSGDWGGFGGGDSGGGGASDSW